MSGLGGYIWFIGLGAGLVLLAVAYVVAGTRRRKPGAVAHPNNAWEEAARETGHPEVARAETVETRPRN